MNKDIHKYIHNCACVSWRRQGHRYAPVDFLQTTDIPETPFDKIAIDLASDFNVSASGNHHILIIIDYLTGWPEADKKADTIVHVFINNYLPIHMYFASYYWLMAENSRTS